MEVWIDGSHVTNAAGEDYTDPDVIRGEHFGLFAQTTTGTIRFADRQVFDVGTEYVARYTGFPDGTLETDLTIQNAGGVSSANSIYFAQMPSAWLAPGLRAGSVAKAFDAIGNEIADFETGARQFSILRNDSSSQTSAYSLWLGDNSSGAGIYAIPQIAELNGVPADAAHAQIDIDNEGRYAISLNPLQVVAPFPPSSQNARTAVTDARLVTHWRPTLESVAPQEIVISNASVVEGDFGQPEMQFDVALNRVPTQIVTVDYQTAGSTATSGVDFAARSGTLIFDPGSSGNPSLVQQISVLIIDDDVDEFDEQFFVSLSNPTNAVLSSAMATGTIVDDDPNVVVSIANAPSILEGDAGTTNMVFQLEVAGAHEKEFRVEFEVTGISATEDSDYTLGPAQFVDFAPGQVSQQINVSINGDTDVELDETLQVQLTRVPGGRVDIAPTPAIGTIVNDDQIPDGDFNDDDAYDCQDIDALVGAIAGAQQPAAFDLTQDGLVDANDLEAWLVESGLNNVPQTNGEPFLPGDANLDGVVDVSDFNLWNNNKFNLGAGWCGGDFNADGTVDVSDFNIWNNNKFRASGALASRELRPLRIAFGKRSGDLGNHTLNETPSMLSNALASTSGIVESEWTTLRSETGASLQRNDLAHFRIGRDDDRLVTRRPQDADADAFFESFTGSYSLPRG